MHIDGVFRSTDIFFKRTSDVIYVGGHTEEAILKAFVFGNDDIRSCTRKKGVKIYVKTVNKRTGIR